MTLYRDPLAGLRGQIASKRGLLESRERALPALLRAMLPERLTRVFAQRVKDDAESLEELSKMDAALDEVLAAHEEAAALLPKLRACPDTVPDPTKPSNVSPPWVIEEVLQLEYRKLFTRRIAELASAAYAVRWDDSAYVSRFALAGAPLFVKCRFDATANQPTVTKSFARTSVPAALPALEVHEEGLFHALGRALHLVRDHRTGDDVFDDLFIVDADDAAAQVIGPDVRAAFATLAAAQPQLVVGRGVAELHWRSAWASYPESLLPDAAFAILLGIRAAIERA